MVTTPATFRAEPSSNRLMNCAQSHLAIALATSATLLCGTASAQIHRVEKPESVTRAVAVYEYAGELQKPTAARLIPVSLYLGGHFEDAGTYLSQPVPLSLQTDTTYELEHAGTPLGLLDLAYAKNFRQNTAETANAIDDGWFGYGKFRTPKTPKPVVAKNNGKSTGHAYEVQDDGKPHFGSKPDSPEKTSSRRAPDPDPADERATKISLPDDRDPNSPNPDRPTLRRSATDTNGGPKQKKQKETASVSQTPPSPNDDPDRPTIRRKSADEVSNDGIPPDPSELSSKKSVHGEGGTVTAGPTIADGSRPALRRGKTGEAETMAEPQKVAAAATKPDLKLAVAVSDARSRTEHDFRYNFGSEAERATAMQNMRQLAAAVLANPALATDAPEFTKVSAAVPARKSTAAGKVAARSSAATRRKAGTHSPGEVPASPALADEQFAAYTLSYGASVTYVYTASATSDSGATRYVTVVAQPDPDGKLQIGLRTVTDTQHLDRIQRYRFVDVVDADASNRASLLFELQAQNTRQFALFRLLGPKPDQIFETGLTR